MEFLAGTEPEIRLYGCVNSDLLADKLNSAQGLV
jgi:hypothetical protein